MIAETSHLLLKAIFFASQKHRFQTRKDQPGTPYINHPIEVGLTLAEIGNEKDAVILMSAILHDTIEDTDTTPDEIEMSFGRKVMEIVMEVTDDKSLPKQERKRLQVLQAGMKSEAARKIKLADKICNVNDILYRPPHGWSLSRKMDYLLWAQEILEGLRGTNIQMEAKLQGLISEGKQMLQEAPGKNKNGKQNRVT